MTCITYDARTWLRAPDARRAPATGDFEVWREDRFDVREIVRWGRRGQRFASCSAASDATKIAESFMADDGEQEGSFRVLRRSSRLARLFLGHSCRRGWAVGVNNCTEWKLN